LEIEELKLFLRIDGTDEDLFIQGLQFASEEYMLNAGVRKDYTKFLYSLAVKMLVGHWYENRSVVGKADKLAFSLDTMILQLIYTQVELVV
jgi:uncharacterized phage protein (predicted DNA packaging)